MTMSCFLQVLCGNVLFSSSFVWQCLVFFMFCMTMSCFLQVLCDNVLFSSSFVWQCLVFFKFFDIDQSLLTDFNLCAPTRLVFLTLVRYCW